jgi:hypothetical protein
MKIDEIVPALIGLTIFSGLTAYLAWQLALALGSRRWPTTNGVITESSIVTVSYGTPIQDNTSNTFTSDGRNYRIYYTYQVNGQSYESNGVRFGGWLNSNPWDARATSQRYPAGKSVTVFYNPRNPRIATLETRVSGLLYILLTIGILAIGSIAGALLGLWK